METRFTTAAVKSAKQDLEKAGVNDKTVLTRHELAQFFTPEHIADFMASLFVAKSDNVELLDAGAGTGALSAALVRRLTEQRRKPKRIAVTAYEVDRRVGDVLRGTLSECQERSDAVGIEFSCQILPEDFITGAVASLRSDLFAPETAAFNIAIVNPPYRKLRTDSNTRRLLRSIGIETSNFYSAFVALILRLLAKGGECVAITPRSFCNGPYFKPFRTELLDTSALHRLHLFESRTAAFDKDNVLQENVIFHAIKGEPQPKELVISISSGGKKSPVLERKVSYCDVVLPSDPERFIHIGFENRDRSSVGVENLQCTLGDLGLTVSTGRVVDFRAKSFLRKHPSPETAPLIYPAHFNRGFVFWPRNESLKANAIVIHDKTRDLLVPAGVYVLVKRFSSKEERRRIVACIYDPKRIRAPLIGFENHLNYFHVGGKGMPMDFAKGMAMFLNSTLLDNYFRRFSGHTQVNAADLRNMKYPGIGRLKSLGAQIGNDFPDQRTLDELVERELLGAENVKGRSGASVRVRQNIDK